MGARPKNQCLSFSAWRRHIISQPLGPAVTACRQPSRPHHCCSLRSSGPPISSSPQSNRRSGHVSVLLTFGACLTLGLMCAQFYRYYSSSRKRLQLLLLFFPVESPPTIATTHRVAVTIYIPPCKCKGHCPTFKLVVRLLNLRAVFVSLPFSRPQPSISPSIILPLSDYFLVLRLSFQATVFNPEVSPP